MVQPNQSAPIQNDLLPYLVQPGSSSSNSIIDQNSRRWQRRRGRRRQEGEQDDGIELMDGLINSWHLGNRSNLNPDCSIDRFRMIDFGNMSSPPSSSKRRRKDVCCFSSCFETERRTFNSNYHCTYRTASTSYQNTTFLPTQICSNNQYSTTSPSIRKRKNSSISPQQIFSPSIAYNSNLFVLSILVIFFRIDDSIGRLQHVNLSTSFSETEGGCSEDMLKFGHPLKTERRLKYQMLYLTSCGRIWEQQQREHVQQGRRRKRWLKERRKENDYSNRKVYPTKKVIKLISNDAEEDKSNRRITRMAIILIVCCQNQCERAHEYYRRRPSIRQKRRQVFLSIHSLLRSNRYHFCSCNCFRFLRFRYCLNQKRILRRLLLKAGSYTYFTNYIQQTLQPNFTVHSKSETFSKCSNWSTRVTFFLNLLLSLPPSSNNLKTLCSHPTLLPCSIIDGKGAYIQHRLRRSLPRSLYCRKVGTKRIRLGRKGDCQVNYDADIPNKLGCTSGTSLNSKNRRIECRANEKESVNWLSIEQNSNPIQVYCLKNIQNHPIKDQSEESRTSLNLIVPSQRAQQHNCHQTAAIENSTGGSESNTSGSIMAEHGHQGGGEKASEGSQSQRGVGEESGREESFAGSMGGASGGGAEEEGGGGGDDRQSSAPSGLGKSGEVIDGRRYHLRIVQQPETGCAFGESVLSRLAIAPPLIVQLKVTDEQNNEIDFDDEIPSLICRVNLITDDGENADMLSPLPISSAQDRQTALQTHTPPAAVSMLYGTLASSAFQLPDIRQRMRTFFIFPEISIRSRGRFRFNVVLIRLPLSGGNIRILPAATRAVAEERESDVPIEEASSSVTPAAATDTPATQAAIPIPIQSSLASIISDPINVVLAADYQAPHITELTRHFAANGVGLLLPPNQTIND